VFILPHLLKGKYFGAKKERRSKKLERLCSIVLYDTFSKIARPFSNFLPDKACFFEIPPMISVKNIKQCIEKVLSIPEKEKEGILSRCLSARKQKRRTPAENRRRRLPVLFFRKAV